MRATAGATAGNSDRSIILTDMERIEITKYKRMLEARLAALNKVPRKRAEIAIERTSDLLDEVQLSAERELALGDLARESRLAREIQAALARIDEGNYGLCLNCEEEIRPGRLNAVPWAAYCLRCQEAAERRELELVNPADHATPTGGRAEGPEIGTVHSAEAA
jgi:RNA polymerase-binding transcription factor